MKKILTLLPFLLFTSLLALGQKQGNIWYFGEGAGLDFNSGAPVLITGGQIFGNPQNPNEFPYSEGSSVLSDSTGSLLLYSNGENIWNRNHQVMPNGDSLMGMYSSTHPALIVPKPLSNSIFYVFTTDGLERNLANGLRYSVVDMCLDNGLGDVIESQKNILLLDTVCEKLTAINHQNGKDIWLLTHRFNSDAFYAYQISELGIVDTVISRIGSVHTGNGFYSALGQMKVSTDGRKIALVASNIVPSIGEVFDFDPTTGVLSNPIRLNTDYNEYGIEFSPDNTKLYFTNLSGLYQFDLLAGGGSAAAINASKTPITNGFACTPAGMQLGPDGKIYIGRCGTYLRVLNNPNAAGAACNYTDYAINLGITGSQVSFPSFVQGFAYHNNTYDCKVVSTVPLTDALQCQLFPNPALYEVTLTFDRLVEGAFSLILYNAQGQVLQTNTLANLQQHVMDVRHLPNGLYFIRVSSKQHGHFVKQLVVDK